MMFGQQMQAKRDAMEAAAAAAAAEPNKGDDDDDVDRGGAGERARTGQRSRRRILRFLISKNETFYFF